MNIRYAIVWNPGVQMVKQIIEEFKKHCSLVTCSSLDLGENYYDFLMDVYDGGKGMDWKLAYKINAMKESSNASEICVIRFTAADDFHYRDFKMAIRERFAPFIKNYKYDVLIHISENAYENNLVVKALSNQDWEGKNANNVLLLWPQNSVSVKSAHVNIPYHFVHNLEVIDYIRSSNSHLVIDNADYERTPFEFNIFIKLLISKDYKGAAVFVSNDNLVNSLMLTKMMREVCPDIKILAYGDLPVLLPGFFIGKTFDYIVSTDCDQEVAISDFYNFAIGQRCESDMQGVKKVVEDRLLPLQLGAKIHAEQWGYPEPVHFQDSERIVITVSRGCPCACSFCNAVLYYGLQERRRPVDSLIRYIKDNNDREYKFFAPNFTLNKQWVRDFCTSILENDIHITWSCTTRADLLDDVALLALMAKCGCRKIAVGVESMVDMNLDNIHKQTNSETIIRSIKRVQEAGITYKALVMLGIPGQTKEHIYETLERLYALGVQVRPTAYTPFYQMNASMSPEELERYDKRTFYAGVTGLSYGNFLRLIYDTENYKEYLR